MAAATHETLRASADIVAVLRGRRQRAGSLVVVHVGSGPNTDAPARIAVVASRRVGGAVERNRAKRLLREAARTRPWLPGQDIVLVARGACASANLHEVVAELTSLAVHLELLIPGDELTSSAVVALAADGTVS